MIVWYGTGIKVPVPSCEGPVSVTPRCFGIKFRKGDENLIIPILKNGVFS